MALQIIRKIVNFFKRDPDRKTYRKEFVEYLNAQAKIMQKPLAIFAMAAWLDFAFNTDPILHPDFTSLLYFRLGLTVVGTAVLILTLSEKLRGKGLGLLHVMLGYSLFTCAFFTGRLADDANYVSGFQILILVSTFLPARLIRIYQYLIISILLFLGSASIYKPGLNTMGAYYSMNNLLIAYVLGFILAFILDRYRFNTFINQYKILQSNKKLKHEMSERERIQEALKESEEKYREILDNIDDGYYEVDLTGRFTFFNDVLPRFLGYTREELLETNFKTTMDDNNAKKVFEAFNEVYATGVPARLVEFETVRKDKTTAYVESSIFSIRNVQGKTIGFRGVVRDITERKQFHEKLRAMAVTDDLTGLYNRRGFFTLAEQQLKIAERTKKKIMLAFVDLDDMKRINDVCGHDAGDRALMDTAEILGQAFRKSDIIARLGGDEFAIMAADVTDDMPDIFLTRLWKRLNTLNGQDGRSYNLSMSIGVVLYEPENPCSFDELISRADQMMYENKRRKKESKES